MKEIHGEWNSPDISAPRDVATLFAQRLVDQIAPSLPHIKGALITVDSGGGSQ